METLLPALATPALTPLRQTLDRLGNRPPQVLLLEGGTGAQRMDAARYWAARVNCPQAQGSPCLSCPTCRQIAAGEHLDWFALDGRISNREDEENPGPIRAFNMERVRELKSRLRDAPHGNGRRVVTLLGLGLTRDEAANALLKALEEPTETTLFVLLAPQREQLLPTLVSRAFCLTLPWPDSRADTEDSRPWEDELGIFVQQGTGLLDRTAAKGALDAALAADILLCCQKSMSRVLAGQGQERRPLDMALAGLAPRRQALACRWLAEAQEALRYGVTPARVVEALASRLFVLRADGARHPRP